MRAQIELFGTGPAPTPAGFRYQADAITAGQEAAVLRQIQDLAFHNFQFHGFEGRRRVVSYGWRYDFERSTLVEAEPLPGFLDELRDLAGRFADLAPGRIRQALVTEYSAGSAIGWHRDKPMFDDVIGLSLLSACTFRLRRRTASGWERHRQTVEPRSIYLLRGPARTEWEHSIPPVDALRYSITFRTFRDDAA